jgi:RNA polymerase sigma factor (sigma-70 family)
MVDCRRWIIRPPQAGSAPTLPLEEARHAAGETVIDEEVGPPDADLLRAATAGSPTAYAEFFRRHVRAVTAFGLRRCSTPDQVADLVADTFLIALHAAHRYKAETETALPWLYGIARRVILRQRRTRSRRDSVMGRLARFEPEFRDSEEDAVAAALDAARQAPLLQAALRRLSDSEREVLELVAYDGLTPTEVAIVLGVSPNAVRLRLSRARKKMREGLDPALAGHLQPGVAHV